MRNTRSKKPRERSKKRKARQRAIEEYERHKAEENAKKEKEKKEADEEFEKRVKKTFVRVGYDEESIQRVLDKAEKGDKSHKKEKDKMIMDLRRPTFVKVHCKHISPEHWTHSIYLGNGILCDFPPSPLLPSNNNFLSVIANMI